MKRLLPLLLPLTLAACAPQVRQPVQVWPVQIWEGAGRVLLHDQKYRLTFTVNDQTHDLRGQLQNLSSGDTFAVSGTLLPIPDGAELTATVSAGGGAKLNASILGFGISGLALKSDALLTGHLKPGLFSGTLRVNGIGYPLELRQVR